MEKNMSNKDQQIEEPIEHNDDLEIIFRNTIIPQLFVDADLIIEEIYAWLWNNFVCITMTWGNLWVTSKIIFAFQP